MFLAVLKSGCSVCLDSLSWIIYRLVILVNKLYLSHFVVFILCNVLVFRQTSFPYKTYTVIKYLPTYWWRKPENTTPAQSKGEHNTTPARVRFINKWPLYFVQDRLIATVQLICFVSFLINKQPDSVTKANFCSYISLPRAENKVMFF